MDALAVLCVFAGAAYSQSPLDTAATVSLPEVIVRAERVPVALVRSTVAVTVIDGDQLRTLPGRTLADALQHVPGLSFVDFAGGDDPQAMVRGFYGGGEADYVLLLIDGHPSGSVNAGRINFDLIPLAAVESIEVLRGSGSPMYGDAAVGAAINVRTGGGLGQPRWALSAGERGLSSASIAAGSGRVTGFADFQRHDGFRRHAARRIFSGGATAAFVRSDNASLTLSTSAHDRRYDSPGPIQGSPRAAPGELNPFFRFDYGHERTGRVALNATRGGSGQSLLTARLGFDRTSSDAVRTLPLSVDFADTKHRALDATSVNASGQIETAIPAVLARAAAGVELSHGRMDTDYATVLAGDIGAYGVAAPPPRAPDASGNGRRSASSAFAQLELEPLERVRIVAGVRADHLADRFHDREGPARRASHSAVSPRLGGNLLYRQGPRDRGHLFASLSRSFKAPTLDQLFDLRSIPVPFPPFAVTLSSDDLKPQRARATEAGARHWVTVAGLTLDLSTTAYLIRMEDELDFDVERLRFTNIGRSRHRGVESSFSVSSGLGVLFVSHVIDDTRATAGEHAGRRLKAVPRTTLRAGASGNASGVAVSVTVSSARGAYLDDANTRWLPGFERADLRLGRQVRNILVSAEVMNVFNRAYSSTGFLDPAGSGNAFYYPAARRSFRVAVSTAN